MINKDTVHHMKKQMKVSNTLIEETKNNILKEKKKKYLKPSIILGSIGAMVIVLLVTIISINNNNNGKSLLSMDSLIVSVYAAEDSQYYLTANYEEETYKQILNSDIEVKLAKYNKAMSNVPGIPISFDFDCENATDKDYIKISISNGEILHWNKETGAITKLGTEYKSNNNDTLYFNINSDTIITLAGVKNNKEIFTRNIKITIDNEYNYYAAISEYQYN